MRYIFSLSFSFFLLACQNGDSTTSKAEQKRDSLLGSWTNDTSGKATMEIRQTDIYYLFMPDSFPYKIVGDTIELTRVDGTFIGPIKWGAKATFKKDTISVYDRGELVKYWRVKPRNSAQHQISKTKAEE